MTGTARYNISRFGKICALCAAGLMFAATAAAETRNEPMRVVLSFDDSLKDHLLIAAPMLEERGWRGVFNVVTDWVGKDDRHLTWDDVRELLRRGHEVRRQTRARRRRDETDFTYFVTGVNWVF